MATYTYSFEEFDGMIVHFPVGKIFSINWGGPWSYRKLKVVGYSKVLNGKTKILCEDV